MHIGVRALTLPPQRVCCIPRAVLRCHPVIQHLTPPLLFSAGQALLPRLALMCVSARPPVALLLLLLLPLVPLLVRTTLRRT